MAIVLCAEYFIWQKKPDILFEIIARHLLFLQRFSPDVSRSLNGPFWSLTHADKVKSENVRPFSLFRFVSVDVRSCFY